MFDYIQKHFFELLLTGTCAVFVVGFLVAGNIAGGSGYFEGLGNTVKQVNIAENTLNNDSFSKMDTTSLQQTPDVVYLGGSQTVGTNVVLRDMLSLSAEGEIYLYDIRDEDGNSVLEFHTQESMDASDESNAAFIYVRDTDNLYFGQSGCYEVFIKVYGNNGSEGIYKFTLPVEVG